MTISTLLKNTQVALLKKVRAPNQIPLVGAAGYILIAILISFHRFLTF